MADEQRRPSRRRSPGRQADRVYVRLKECLFLEPWALPGMKWTEHGLSTLFGTSRAPVREALQRLVQERYLAAHYRNGYTVKGFSTEMFKELTDVRILLECQALRLSRDHPALTEELETLRHVWEAPEERVSFDHMTRMNREFHLSLVRLGGNEQLSRVHADVLERVEVVQRLDFTAHDRVEATYREHLGVINALARGQTEQAVSELTDHIQKSTAAVNDRMTDYFEAPPTPRSPG
ncbi:GntR family transcriptional regulator [Aquisalimonas asiatica]|nr:GntR family transcriptional regulator [Aquisalimonas asiatica]